MGLAVAEESHLCIQRLVYGREPVILMKQDVRLDTVVHTLCVSSLRILIVAVMKNVSPL